MTRLAIEAVLWGYCPHCKHPWFYHEKESGCVVLVDSAYTTNNTRACGCRAVKSLGARVSAEE